MAENGLVLVTGATGFVGKWTVIELLKKGYSVRGTIRSLGKVEEVRNGVATQTGSEALERLDLIEADLLEDSGWAEAMQGVGAVMHVAAAIRSDEPEDAGLVVRPALEGTQRVMRFAQQAGIKRVILTSSVATVGYGHGHTTGRRVYDESYFTQLDQMKYTWAYCVGKTKAEQWAWAFAAETGLELTTIHPGAILGPAIDADHSISLGTVLRVVSGQAKAVPDQGFAVIDVRDVAAAHVAALEKPEAIGQRYLTAGEFTRLPDIPRILAEAYPDFNIQVGTIPGEVLWQMVDTNGTIKQIINDIGNEKHYDPSKGEALIGRKFISSREAILAAAQSAIDLGLVQVPRAAQ